MQELGKKFPERLQKSAGILMTEFYGHKNVLMIQRKTGQSCTSFQNTGLSEPFEEPECRVPA